MTSFSVTTGGTTPSWSPSPAASRTWAHVFLDRWYLAPGRPWPQALEEALHTCRAVAVFLGPAGMGPWQQREHYLALDRQAASATFPVIPVLLPGADPALGFLGLNTWVDLRDGSRRRGARGARRGDSR